MKTTIFLLTALVTVSLFASVGRITEIDGTAFIKQQSNKGFKKLTPNLDISKGDVIRTMNNSFVDITFDDESTLKVYPKSIVKIDKNITDKNNSKSITLFSGRLWAKVHKRITKKNFFKINTPTATAGVRGTSFGVVVSPNGSSLVRVKSGRVLFDSDIDPKLLKEEKKENNKKESESAPKPDNLMQPQELKISTSSINREDNSIDTDIVTGIKRKSIILRKDSTASFRLEQGIKPEANIPVVQFETEEDMPQDPQKRKEIVTWHISNLKHRVKTAKQLVFKVTKIAGGIESMKSDKKFTVEQISATTKKGKKEIDHISETIENMENSMNAQLYFLENYAKDDPDVQKVFEEHQKFVEEKDKVIK
jgi:hypothetical protein